MEGSEPNVGDEEAEGEEGEAMGRGRERRVWVLGGREKEEVEANLRASRGFIEVHFVEPQ